MRWEDERQIVQDLGLIELRVFRVLELGSSTFKPNNEQPGLTQVPEKALKGRAVFLGTQFGTQSSPAGGEATPRYRDVQRLPTDDGPIGVYRFAYRSRG